MINNYLVYLAGGMTNLNLNDQCAWRVAVKKELENYECDYKVKCINPVAYYSVYDSSAYDSDLEVMNFDLHKLKTSNLVVMNFNDKYSLGTMAELAIAYERGIPVIGLNESEQQLHPWQYCFTSKIFNNKEDMLMYIKNYYLD